jgi:uncharacterized heparinase superfamily protein
MPQEGPKTLARAGRVAWTVRYLKARQIAGQVRYRLRGSRAHPGEGNGKSAEGYPGCLWPRGVSFLPPGPQQNRSENIRMGVLEFVNLRRMVGFPPRWDGLDLPKLWQYNLHYFEWLWALDYVDARTVVLDWMQKHALRKDAVGWEPYPTSLRLMNWCAVFWGRLREDAEADGSFLAVLWRSICRQTQWLMEHLETHLLNNHYLENGAALAFVGSCFPGVQGRRWLGRGDRILRDQVAEQILPDGMHFELSPMYHCRVLYVLALLTATGNSRLQERVADPLSRMSRALDHLWHPDGRIALLNDSAFDIANEPGGLASYSGSLLKGGPPGRGLQTGCFALEQAGYYGWRGPEGTYVIVDCGKIGPDHTPGHGHADLFGFELSLGGHRVITDSGVHDYASSAARRYCRSTAAHNTVEIDGQDQCELWGAFRVARRGYPRAVSWHPRETGFVLSGWHDGYRRLRGQPIHFRWMQSDGAHGLAVHDRITAGRPVRCVSRVHLHPACRIARAGRRVVQVSFPGGRFQVEADTEIETQETLYCDGFYLRRPRPCLCLSGRGNSVEFRYRIRIGPVSAGRPARESHEAV